MAGPSGASYKKKQANNPCSRRFPLAKDAEGAKEERGGAGSGNPFSREDAEGVAPGSDPGRANYKLQNCPRSLFLTLFLTIPDPFSLAELGQYLLQLFSQRFL